MEKKSSGLQPTGRTFIVDYKGKKYRRKEYRNEYVNMPHFRINGAMLAIPESHITEVDNEYR